MPIPSSINPTPGCVESPSANPQPTANTKLAHESAESINADLGSLSNTSRQPSEDQPLVSIIIPCYNAEKYVAEAIQSALDQTYPNCEIIVIDDGSSDGSLEVIKSFGDKIRWETGPNRGGCAARNWGLELAKGEWFQFLDADDTIVNKKISLQLDLAAQPELDCSLLCSEWSFSTAQSEEDSIGTFPEDSNELPALEFIAWSWVKPSFFYPPHSWLVRRRLVEEAGLWDETLSAGQDIEYFYGKVLSCTDTVACVNQRLAMYRTALPNSVSKQLTEGAYLSRLAALERVASWVSLQDSNGGAISAVAHRLSTLALEGYEFSTILGDRALSQAVDMDRHPFRKNPSPFLRLTQKFLGPRNSALVRKLIKKYKSHIN